MELQKKNLKKYNEKIAMKTSRYSVIGNILLSMLKFIAGIFANSSAMISDAVHSASDVFSTFVVIIGLKVSNKESDQSHPYGHERFECVASIYLALILGITGLGIGYGGIRKILTGNYEYMELPGVFALIVAIISIVVKEGMYWYTKNTAKRINSCSMMADAWHHRSDALSSVGSLIGIFGARIGYPVCDSLASVIICIFILKASIDIFKDSVGKMTDKSCDEQVEDRMKEVVLNQDGVIKIDIIKTRLFGSRIYVDIEICADGDLSLKEAHEIAESVHCAIEEQFLMVKHCMIRVNPLIIQQ